jgi:hypothetical protein
MFIILYLAITLVMLYSEALDCYRTKVKFNILGSLLFSFAWIISLPWSIYSIWAVQQKDTN